MAERERFLFTSDAVASKAFHVVRFAGEEGLSQLYRFDITLACSSSELNTAAMLRAGATLRILRDKGDTVFRGILTEVSQTSHYNGYTFYNVVLQPRFQILTRVVQNQIFMEMPVRDVVKGAMAFSSSFSLNHEFRLLASDYPTHEFTMQYNESVFDYICNKLESEGIYYFFEPAGGDEKVVFTDSPLAHTDLAATPTLAYLPVTGLEASHMEEIITSFALHSTPLPANVLLRAYDWMKPNEPVTATSPVSPDGLGDVYYYGENFTTAAEGKRLATIRAQELLCRSAVYSGASSVPTMRPGFRFTMERHYRNDFNRVYTLTQVRHYGSQEGFLAAALGIRLGESPQAEHSLYRNEFSCIAADCHFRPSRLTPRNKIQGVIPAFIDAAGSGAKPELDAYGRYKVVFPFDLSGRSKGKASCWLRMTQQYVGKSFGATFPLTAGTEVTVSFVDGDPDRPLITGAVSNAESGAIVNEQNAPISGISTAGGSALAFSDEDYKQGISLTTASGRTGMSMFAGSTDASYSTSDILLDVANIAGSEMTALGKTMWGSFRNVTLTGLGWEYNLCSAVAKALNAADKMFATAAKKTGKQDWNGGCTAAKNAALICQLIPATKGIYGMKFAYGQRMRAGETGSIHQLQTPPKLSELLGPILTAFAGMLGTCAATAVSTKSGESEEVKKQYDAAKDKGKKDIATISNTYRQQSELPYAPIDDPLLTPDQWNSRANTTINTLNTQVAALEAKKAAHEADPKNPALTEEEKKQLETYKKDIQTLKAAQDAFCVPQEESEAYKKITENVKVEAKKTIAISSANTLLPEIISIVMTVIPLYVKLKGYRDTKSMGGLLLDTDSNIAVSAKKDVHIASGRDILLNAMPNADMRLAKAMMVRPDLIAHTEQLLDSSLAPATVPSPPLHGIVMMGEKIKTFGNDVLSCARDAYTIVTGDSISLISDGHELNVPARKAYGVLGPEVGEKTRAGSSRLDLKTPNAANTNEASATLKVEDPHGELTLSRSDNASQVNQSLKMDPSGLTLSHLIEQEPLKLSLDDDGYAVSFGGARMELAKDSILLRYDADTSILLNETGIIIKGKTVKITAGKKDHIFSDTGLRVTGRVNADNIDA